MSDTHPTHPTRTRRFRRAGLALLVVVATAAGSLVLGNSSASAGYNVGVKYVHFDDGAHACFPGQWVICDPADGVGVSNTLYVTQSLVDGEYRYTNVVGTAADPDLAWLSVTIEAGCRADYKLHSGHIALGHSDWEGWNDPDEAGEWSWVLSPRDLSYGDKTMSFRHLAMNLPVDELLVDVLGGNSVGQLLQSGEDMVASDIDGGTHPETARLKSHSVAHEMPMHAEITCKRGGLFDLEREMHNSATVPLEIVWLGVGQVPGDAWRDAVLPEPAPHRNPVPTARPAVEPADVPLTSATWVTQAHLSVVPDPVDACRLHLSGVVTTNGETDVQYRFIDDLGIHSQTFTAAVDQTFTTMLDHHVDLEPVPSDGEHPGGLGFTAEDAGGIGGLVGEDTDREQGYYRLEVLTPNPMLSDVASYNVSPCVEDVVGPTIVSPTTTTTTTSSRRRPPAPD